MQGFAGTFFHEGAVSALEKIRATLPKALSERVRAAEEVISSTPGEHDYRSRGGVLREIAGAIEHRRTLEVRYRSAGRTAKWRRLDPYHLRVTGQGVYLVGWAHEASEPRTFLLDRILEVRDLGQSFHARSNFQASSFLSHHFAMWGGEVKNVRFTVSSELAHLVLERKVHPSQLSQRRADGSVGVRMRVAIVPPLISWLAGFGGAVSEVRPSELAHRLRELHETALGNLRT